MNHKKNLVTVQTMLLVVNHHTCTQMPWVVKYICTSDIILIDQWKQGVSSLVRMQIRSMMQDHSHHGASSKIPTNPFPDGFQQFL